MRIARTIALLLVVGICASWARAQEGLVVTAAGATFPQPLYEAMIAKFMQMHSGMRINYGGGGSGQGIKGITDGTLAFAGSDAPMSAAELAKAGGPDAIVQVPSCAGAVVPACNLPGVNAEIHFTGEVLADIYVGNINRWNDAKLQELNPGVALPDLAITPVWRSEGSGTTFVWTSFLCGRSEDFRSTVGAGKSVHFPLGLGGVNTAGVAAIIQQTPGAIGYVEQNYADMNHLPYGAVRNQAGQFVKASIGAVVEAGSNAAEKLSGSVLKANIWDQDGDGVYPISSFTYLIARKDLSGLRSRSEAQAVVDFLWFATHDGQSLAGPLYYAPLAAPVRAKVEAALEQFTYDRQPITANP